MTYEEAIYCLTVMRNEVLDTWEFDFSNEETDALGLALEAMELQVAKKVKKKAEYDVCPVCGILVRYYYSPIDQDWKQEYRDTYCSGCGQKLDWSEE